MKRHFVVGLSISFAMLFLGAAAASAQVPSSVGEYANSLAPTVNSPQKAVDRMLSMANLKKGETLYDLGCGEGRILITAAKHYQVKAVGIEISNHEAQKAADKVRKAGLGDRVTIVHGDFMKTDLSHADVVTLYLATSANESLRPTLERSLRPNSRVVSYDYPIPGWRPITTEETKGAIGDTHVIYLYEVPDSINR